MPFWLKHQRTTSWAWSEVVIWEASRSPGDNTLLSFLGLLLVSWIVIGALGILLGCVCCRKARVQHPARSEIEAVRAWERLATKAIRFVALAWHSPTTGTTA